MENNNSLQLLEPVPIQCTLRFIWVHAKVVLNIRWAHISFYSFCHVRHHILVQAEFNECSVKIAYFSKPIVTIKVPVSILLSSIFF